MTNPKTKPITNLEVMVISFVGSVFGVLMVIVIMSIMFPAISKEAYYFVATEDYTFDQDVILDITTAKCSKLLTDEGKVYCVYNIFNSLYDYTMHNSSWIRTPTETLLEGGVCRDAVVYYCAAFKRLNISCRVEAVKNHVFNIVDLEGKYCVIDQNDVRCK